MNGALLGIWAHPDDEAYLSAGLMAAARRAGRRVVVVTATAGERGTNDPDRWRPARLGALRRQELRASLAVLGVHEHRVLGLPDGRCADVDGTVLIADVIADVQPDTIVTFGPDGMTGHPDHRAVSQWATDAWRAAGHPGELLDATLTTSFHERWGAVNDSIGLWSGIDDPPCDVNVDVEFVLDGQRLDQKLAALRADTSQTTPLIDLLVDDVFREWWATESFVSVRPLHVAATGDGSGLSYREFDNVDRSHPVLQLFAPPAP
jgi:LmbE family N-acetylglucosaminyl deacetylase